MSPCRSVLSVAFLAGCLALVPALSIEAATITWTGAGDGTNWNDASNWDSNAVPTSVDEAKFTGNSGLAPGKIIVLGADQIIDQLTFDTTNSIRLGATNGAINALTLTDISRTAASSNTQVIHAKVYLAGVAASPGTWDIQGRANSR